MSSKNTLNYLQFFKEVGKSKRLLRSGWVREKIKDPESIAEHSFRIGVLVMILADKFGYNLDKIKLMKMALIHDLGASITGDVVSTRGEIIDLQKRDEKEIREREEIRKVFDKVGEGDEYVAVFDEMINRITVEAKVFEELDKLEMALQAFEYEEEQGKNLEEFFMNTEMFMKESLLKEIFKDILKNRRKEYEESLRKKLEGKA